MNKKTKIWICASACIVVLLLVFSVLYWIPVEKELSMQFHGAVVTTDGTVFQNLDISITGHLVDYRFTNDRDTLDYEVTLAEDYPLTQIKNLYNRNIAGNQPWPFWFTSYSGYDTDAERISFGSMALTHSMDTILFTGFGINDYYYVGSVDPDYDIEEILATFEAILH